MVAPPVSVDADAEAAPALSRLDVEHLLLPVLIQLVARVSGLLARRLGQPGVVGEIVAGLFLGPSFFGLPFPETCEMVI